MARYEIHGGTPLRGSVTISGTAIAAVLGVILAKVLPREDAEEAKAAKQEAANKE